EEAGCEEEGSRQEEAGRQEKGSGEEEEVVTSSAHGRRRLLFETGTPFLRAEASGLFYAKPCPHRLRVLAASLAPFLLNR
ncbi:MAG TPA: hypothetical protein PK729_16430, partial [Candidatus Hydrogenedentes bacterium]|nr:hypothetical protein [Candidatus Hydrogenedentota bacterium]